MRVVTGLGKRHSDKIDLGGSASPKKKKKAFKYYGSETMAAELLDRICLVMGQHDYKFKLASQRTLLPTGTDEIFGGQDEIKKSFKSYCYSFVEEWEDVSVACRC